MYEATINRLNYSEQESEQTNKQTNPNNLQFMISVRQVPEGSGEQRKMHKTGCGASCGATTIFAVKKYVNLKVILTILLP